MSECQKLFGKARVFGQPGGGVDVVVNFTGGDTWTRSLRVLRRDGRLLTCGATAGFAPTEDIRYIWVFELKIIGSNAYMREDIVACLELASQGKLEALIDETYTLEDAHRAFERVENRHVLGKVVITP